jgi:hypothetical protein
MIYKAADGSRLTNEQAHRYGVCIFDITNSQGGNLTPQDIVSHAKSSTSPLHDFFEWDDTIAAQAWRLQQASYMMRSIHVVIKINERKETTRFLWNVRESPADADDKPARVYVSINRVLAEEELREQVIEEALHQLTSWRARYKQYQEFRGVVEAIEALQD